MALIKNYRGEIPVRVVQAARKLGMSETGRASSPTSRRLAPTTGPARSRWSQTQPSG